MALQTPELVMLGLGVLDDKAPHDTLPPVADGVHLRWGFPREHGFPPYGFYLFRRAHIERWFRLKEPLPTGPGFATDGPKLRAIFTDAPPDLVLGDERFIIEMVGDRALPEAPPPYALPHTREFEIRFLWQIPNSPEQGTSVYAMELDLEFRRPAAVTVTALFDGEPILKRDIRGGGVPGEQTVRLEAGAMTEVRITPGAVALTGLRVLPVMYRAAEGWQEIPSFPYPLDLPIEPGLTLDENRQRARSRVHFQRPADTEALRDRFAGPGSDLPASGQVTLTRGSAIVRGVPDAHGIGTDWGRELQGAVLETDAGGPYTILSVVASDRLVLSRPPEITQPSATVSYRIREDTFGQLHDYLSLLRQGDQQQDPMANRALPAPLYLEGQIRVQAGDPPSLVRRVGGTQWSGELSGMTLTPVEYEAGTVTVEHGSPAVRDDGNTADWDESLVGRRWQLAGQTALYIIEAVDDAGQTLTLDRAYLGPSESGKTYRIYQDLSYRIEQVNGPDEMLLAQPFVAEGDGPWSYAIFPPVDSAAGGDRPALLTHYPLDLVLMAAAHPAMAQILGLYWIDTAEAGVDPAKSYDYLLLTGYDRDFARLLEELRDRPGELPGALARKHFKDGDAYIVFDKRLRRQPPPAAVSEPKAYVVRERVAALGWETDEEQLFAPDIPVLYHLWRTRLPNAVDLDEGPQAADPVDRIDEDDRVATLLAGHGEGPSKRPPDWPQTPLNHVDILGQDAPEGWYSYRVVGVDIFGRHTPFSAPAAWQQWDPPPGVTPPWYYDPARAEDVVNPFAALLADKTPPPPPAGVEALALDPQDPYVRRDEAYENWRARTGREQVGLRVRWRWPERFQQQAPDTERFHVYYKPSRLNALVGQVTEVSLLAPEESLATVALEGEAPQADAGDYAGAWLRAGRESYRVLGNDEAVEAGERTVRLRVRNVHAMSNLGRVYVERGSDTVSGENTGWSEDADGMVLHVHGDDQAHRVAKSESSTQLKLKGAFAGQSSGEADYDLYRAPQAGQPCALEIPPDHPLAVDYTLAASWRDHGQRLITIPAGEQFRRVGDNAADRLYEILMPAPGSERPGEPFTPTRADPIVYASLGVSAVDDKDNESYLAGQAKVFRVLRTPPPIPPPPPPSEEKIFATPADYHSRSYYTFHYPQPGDGLQVHVLRAMDKSVVERDWLIRSTRGGLDPEDPRHKRHCFPVGLSDPQAVADELNAIEARNEYDDLSDEAWQTLALLPGNEGIVAAANLGGAPRTMTEREVEAAQQALADHDWHVRQSRLHLEPGDGYFPQHPAGPDYWQEERTFQENGAEVTKTRGRAVADALNGIASKEDYRAFPLPNHTWQVLAGLPGNEAAFSQVTLEPLDPGAPENRDRRGPDDPEAYEPQENLRAYVDTLDGRARNAYFYRALYVDGAHNRGGMSLSTPPVHLRDVTPPRSPVITKAVAGHPDEQVAGDRMITLHWMRGHGVDLAHYRVYRTDRKEDARDIRLMQLVADAVPPGTERTVPWTDEDVQPHHTFYYRVVAVDTAGNASEASKVAVARAFGIDRPDPPTWSTPSVDSFTGTVVLSWSSPDSNLRCLVQRQDELFATWVSISSWLPRGHYQFTDTERGPDEQHTYRLGVMNVTGVTNAEYDELTV